MHSVWLVTADGTLRRIDPQTLREKRAIPHATTTIEASEPKLAFDRNAVWISSPAESNVAQIDPARGTVQRHMLIGATGVSAGAGAVWVADDAKAIWKFGAGRPQRIQVGPQPLDIAATSDGVWVADSGNQTLVRLDPSSRRIAARVKLQHRPVALAAGSGVVAVAVLGPR